LIMARLYRVHQKRTSADRSAVTPPSAWAKVERVKGIEPSS
jgi:hypothetical protein